MFDYYINLYIALFTTITILKELFSKLKSSIIIYNYCNAANIKYFTNSLFNGNDHCD